MSNSTLTINFGSTDFSRRTPRIYTKREEAAFKHYIELIRTGDVISLPSFFVGDDVPNEIPTLAFKGENGLVVYDFREKSFADSYRRLKNILGSQITYVHVTEGFPEITNYKSPTNSTFNELYFGPGDYPAMIYAVLSMRIKSYFISYDRAVFNSTLYDDGYRVEITGLDQEGNLNVTTVIVDNYGYVAVMIDDKYHHIGVMSGHQM